MMMMMMFNVQVLHGVPTDMASYGGNRSVHRPADIPASSYHDSRSSNPPQSFPSSSAAASGLPSANNRALLADAVESVVNTFSKHARGYGRGALLIICAN